MHDYEAPKLVKVGSVTELTMGDYRNPGQDFLSWIPIVGHLFGS